MTERGIRPYPMVYGARERTLPLGNAPASLERRTLAEFQGWAIRRYYTVVDFADYDVSARDRGTEPRRRCRHCSRALPAGTRSGRELASVSVYLRVCGCQISQACSAVRIRARWASCGQALEQHALLLAELPQHAPIWRPRSGISKSRRSCRRC
jgi:hypothetical protein